ncbi:serine--tRNA ligase [Candidatus Woesebacteria bacterium]|nr:serine--tRNA ligase [Candidatus Woesebacteria bacterium]
MLDIQLIRDNPDKVKDGVQKKGYDPKVVDRVLELDKKRRGLLQEVEKVRQERNEVAKKKDVKLGQQVKEELKKLEADLSKATKDFEQTIYDIPNLPFDDVPVGKDESANKVLRKWGKPKKFDFKVRDHIEIGERLGIIDLKTAAKVSGTRFSYLKGDAALLEFALVKLAFDTLVKKGFTPVVPPTMIRPDVFTKMARLGKNDKDDRYHLPKDDLYLVGSAEHTLGPLHMDETIPEGKLPIRYAGFSTSFRREAGSYGKDTKGILRVHQFDKVEMESFTVPEDSTKEQELIVSIQEDLMQQLGIPYQVIDISTGDMGAPNVKQIDIEAWMPGQGKYRETHTSDLMTDYQARRLNTRVRRKDGSTEFVHMNDATALAIGRTIIAILENNQQKDGSVVIPEVLRPYMGKDKISPK